MKTKYDINKRVNTLEAFFFFLKRKEKYGCGEELDIPVILIES